MNPSDETPLWQEIKRLREQLDYANERHTAALANIRGQISELEAKLGQSATNSVESAAVPPPLPKAPLTAARPKADATDPPDPEPVVTKTVSVPAQPEPMPAREPKPDGSFELDFGKVWFVRIGIVILLTGLVFLGNYAYQNWIKEMPNGVRLAALFACALGLVETGRRLAAKENLNRFGEVLLAGGMAFFYYCTFAAHHVGRLKVIDSPVLAAVLLFCAAGSIAAVSWLRKAKATAALGFVLAAYSTMLQPIGWMSCVSNMLLGAMGLFFMLKPGWSGPGWASMLGSYGAFFGWQLLGASGKTIRTDDPASLWFLPPLWVMFAIPGVLGSFRESLSDRARAWFTGANNALFFLLFSGIWLARNGDDNYWKVAAVFGSALIALGILGRRQSTTAGGVNIAQGLGVVTFALILKLDGHHLALVLAMESLMLALAACKYRGKSEVVFSLLAGIGGAGLATLHDIPIPIWSAAIVAHLLAASSVVTTRIKPANGHFAPFVRFSAAILFIAATVVASHLCLFRMGETASLLTAVALSGILSLASLKLDVKRLQPEIVWAAIWFLGVSGWIGLHDGNAWVLLIAAAVALGGCWIWHRQPEPDGKEPTWDLAKHPAVPAWAFSLAVPLFAFMAILEVGEGHPQILNFHGLAALLVAGCAIALRCKRLLATASAMAIFSLEFDLRSGIDGDLPLFIATLISVFSAALIHLQWSRERVDRAYREVASWIFRLTAFAAYCTAWHRHSPENWSDWLALTSIALTLGTLFLKRKLLPESVALAAVSVVALAIASVTSPWHLSPDENGWRGITVVIALLTLVLTYRQRPALIANPEIRSRAISGIAGLTCVVATIWATQMLVWRFGWKPSAVLWTVLGFAFVSAGLWQRLHILRVCGFILLVVSFIKLFAVDVWDFTAFMRVASFIVLGAALILLGLFYNKFADAIKALLEDEKGTKASTGEEP
jgi:hypothetical protein